MARRHVIYLVNFCEAKVSPLWIFGNIVGGSLVIISKTVAGEAPSY